MRRKKGKDENKAVVSSIFYAFLQKCISAVEHHGLETEVHSMLYLLQSIQFIIHFFDMILFSWLYDHDNIHDSPRRTRASTV